MGVRKQFTPECKREAGQLRDSGSRPASELAREVGGGAINSINGRGNSRPAARGHSPVPGPARSGPPSWRV